MNVCLQNIKNNGDEIKGRGATLSLTSSTITVTTLNSFCRMMPGQSQVTVQTTTPGIKNCGQTFPN